MRSEDSGWVLVVIAASGLIIAVATTIITLRGWVAQVRSVDSAKTLESVETIRPSAPHGIAEKRGVSYWRLSIALAVATLAGLVAFVIVPALVGWRSELAQPEPSPSVSRTVNPSEPRPSSAFTHVGDSSESSGIASYLIILLGGLLTAAGVGTIALLWMRRVETPDVEQESLTITRHSSIVSSGFEPRRSVSARELQRIKELRRQAITLAGRAPQATISLAGQLVEEGKFGEAKQLLEIAAKAGNKQAVRHLAELRKHQAGMLKADAAFARALKKAGKQASAPQLLEAQRALKMWRASQRRINALPPQVPPKASEIPLPSTSRVGAMDEHGRKP